MIWAEIACKVPNTMVDRLTEFLVAYSKSGVSIENLSVDTFSLDTLEDSPIKSVKVYLPDDPDLAEIISAITAYLADVGPTFPEFVFHQPEVSYIGEVDWANNWKEHFKPSRIGTRLVIKPTWEEFPARDNDLIIELDPGMAFGTGAHPTTRLCLETMERYFFREPPYENRQNDLPTAILDVGTGSGVLAIAAAKMGACQVIGIDIDPGAVEIAQTNLVLNQVDKAARVTSEPLVEVEGDFDIVVANILAEELVRLGGALFSRVRASGLLILSGILIEKEDLVISGFSPYPLTLMEISRDEEWSCLAFLREN
jgi:ribosomal protein L11 methyltransferase